MDNEVPVLNETSDSEDGVSLVDSVSNGLHRSLFTDSEGYFSRYRYTIKPFKYPLSISFRQKAFTGMIVYRAFERYKYATIVTFSYTRY